jgi:hypothetical protein
VPTARSTARLPRQMRWSARKRSGVNGAICGITDAGDCHRTRRIDPGRELIARTRM